MWSVTGIRQNPNQNGSTNVTNATSGVLKKIYEIVVHQDRNIYGCPYCKVSGIYFLFKKNLPQFHWIDCSLIVINPILITGDAWTQLGNEL